VPLFAYDPNIIEAFAGIRATVVHASGLGNGPSPSELLDEYAAGQRAASERLTATAIAEIPSIAAWRRAFTQFGVKPTQHRNAAEALLRRLDKHGDIPSISSLVDMGNLVSIRYALPVAVFDLANIAGALTVRFATGDEEFTDLGATESVHPDPGEVVFADNDDVVSARRWCWRQSAQSATRASTADALLVIEGHHDDARRDIDDAVAVLTRLLAAYQPRAEVVSCDRLPLHSSPTAG
jgi:DNA/RNA-binding domain of Phe-tRNA-synthetase-like protein